MRRERAIRKPTHLSFFLQPAAFVAAFFLAVAPANAQVSGGANVNLSKKPGHDAECAIAQNPRNKGQLFALCNTGKIGFGPGLFAARSTDGGVTWVYPDPSTKTIANGSMNPFLGPVACCDPSLAWDGFGNLFITYLDSAVKNIVTLLSTDGGQTFSSLATFGPANVDQPTVTAAELTAVTGAVWIAWNQSNHMVARGARVRGLGAANIAAFGALQNIPGTEQCNFGDIAIAPGGAVVQVCESPSNGSGPASLLVNIKADGLGPNPFGPTISATTTNVGGFLFIPAQRVESIDAEAGLAFDRNPASPHFRRLYLVYTDERVFPDTDIMLRFSDDYGKTWSDPIRVNDDHSGKSQFLPRIASDPLSGNIAVCWHDCRNSKSNKAMQEFCTIATPAGTTPTFMANAQISAGASISNGQGVEFGDYSGLGYFQGVAHPIWADTSNSTEDNPDGTANFDAYTAPVAGRAAAK